MKTQTKNPTVANKIGQSCRAIFSLKTVILLAVLAFTSFGFKAKAQNEIDITVVNCSSSCTWIVTAYDASSNVIWTSSIGPSCLAVTYNCLNQGILAPALDYIIVSGCSNTYLFGSGGIFSYSQHSSVCCSSSIYCAGSLGTNPSNPPCGSSTGKNILIQMF